MIEVLREWLLISGHHLAVTLSERRQGTADRKTDQEYISPTVESFSMHLPKICYFKVPLLVQQTVTTLDVTMDNVIVMTVL